MSQLRRGNTGPLVGFITQLTVDVGAVGAAAVLEISSTIPGVLAGDTVFVSCPGALTANLGICGGRGSAANTVLWRVVNPTAAPIDPAALPYEFMVLRPSLLRNN